MPRDVDGVFFSLIPVCRGDGERSSGSGDAITTIGTRACVMADFYNSRRGCEYMARALRHSAKAAFG